MTFISTSEKKYYSIGFYNLENLYDTENDPNTLDDDFTDDSDKNWNEDRLQKKVYKLGKIISQLGYEDVSHSPVIVGVAEVENSSVLDDLISSKYLKSKGYSYAHFDSPDERGIDNALLFREEYFKVLEKHTHTLMLQTPEGQRDYTRDILHVKGSLDGNVIHILVNHWPSRRSGNDETVYKRVAAANKNREIMGTILLEEPDAKILIMGDFNDDPTSKSIVTLKGDDLYNPMEQLLTRDEGTLNYHGNWNLFDQVLMTNNFLKPHDNPLRYEKSSIYNPIELQEYSGKYKGNPFRTYAGDRYLGGYSDHFPVYEVFSVRK